jgi:hypothetical protein
MAAARLRVPNPTRDAALVHVACLLVDAEAALKKAEKAACDARCPMVATDARLALDWTRSGLKLVRRNMRAGAP